MSKINSVCIILGPYRNLTTLTASALALHPEIQCLNHGSSFNEDGSTNFLTEFSEIKLDTFISYVLEIVSDNLSVPGDGGVITASHAFTNYKIMRDLFDKRQINKYNVKSIVWKESLINTNIIRTTTKNNFESVINCHRIKFLLPIRNPIDCAFSNMYQGYEKYFSDDTSSKECVLHKLFNIYSWFIECTKQYPGKFMYFFEYEFKNRLCELEQFINVTHNDIWHEDINEVWHVVKKYEPDDKMINLYNNLVATTFADVAICSLFERFVNDYKQ